jgi:hypothetical protein
MRIRLVVVISIVAVVCFAAGAFAAGARSSNEGHVVRTGTRATSVPGLDAPNARAAAFVTQGVLARAKGFTKLTHPGLGQVCLKFKDSTIKPVALAPQLTVEHGWSAGTDLMAQWDRSHSDCPTKGAWLEVLTYDESVPGWTPSDDVAFVVTVP